jgi:D-sedoheptulose 7-phosphate isomerase
MPTTLSLRDALLRKARESRSTQERFFAEESSRIAECAGAMARGFAGGARLVVMGVGGSATDAHHATFEFMQPILEARPPLPAMTLAAGLSPLANLPADGKPPLTLAAQLRLLARKGDIALGITSGETPAGLAEGLQVGREMGLLTIALTGRDGGALFERCDYLFIVSSFSVHRIQETHGTLLHVLWDLVHLARGAEDLL